jgi:hypothetical protein
LSRLFGTGELPQPRVSVQTKAGISDWIVAKNFIASGHVTRMGGLGKLVAGKSQQTAGSALQ